MAVLCYWRGYAYEQRRKLQEELESNAEKDLMECDEEDQEKSADKIGDDINDDKVEAAKEKMKEIEKIQGVMHGDKDDDAVKQPKDISA